MGPDLREKLHHRESLGSSSPWQEFFAAFGSFYSAFDSVGTLLSVREVTPDVVATWDDEEVARRLVDVVPQRVGPDA